MLKGKGGNMKQGVSKPPNPGDLHLIVLFIFGYAGSSLLQAGFLWL